MRARSMVAGARHEPEPLWRELLRRRVLMQAVGLAVLIAFLAYVIAFVLPGPM